MIPPFRPRSRLTTDLAAKSPQKFFLLSVLGLSIFGKAAIAFIVSLAKFRKDSRSNVANVEIVRLKPKQNVCLQCGVSKNFLLNEFLKF